MRWNEITNESEDTNIRIFGRIIPNGEIEADQGYAAMFLGDPEYPAIQVQYEHGKYYVARSSEEIEVFTDPAAVENYLKQAGFTTYDGYDNWNPRDPDTLY